MAFPCPKCCSSSWKPAGAYTWANRSSPGLFRNRLGQRPVHNDTAELQLGCRLGKCLATAASRRKEPTQTCPNQSEPTSARCLATVAGKRELTYTCHQPIQTKQRNRCAEMWRLSRAPSVGRMLLRSCGWAAAWQGLRGAHASTNVIPNGISVPPGREPFVVCKGECLFTYYVWRCFVDAACVCSMRMATLGLGRPAVIFTRPPSNKTTSSNRFCGHSAALQAPVFTYVVCLRFAAHNQAIGHLGFRVRSCNHVGLRWPPRPWHRMEWTINLQWHAAANQDEFVLCSLSHAHSIEQISHHRSFSGGAPQVQGPYAFIK